ncbi:unnamed protein product [Caenorhabditis bovis]|uniref:FAD-binding PCMH-type domain-containing protein n=1 Tax=Caenorhabditis bovis TaxID=2654633 RepID=A0A8S1EA49_9PELO|nr:unnamed protein product [Caenorhabditis bovis]
MSVLFNVNGRDVHADALDPELSLADYLRNSLGLRGTKLACEEGVCGSCTVVLGEWDERENRAHYSSVNACLVPAFQVHGKFVITVEGIGSADKLHPIQERLVKGHGVQCGFCSPGFVMSAYALLRNNPTPTIDEITRAVRSNLCRCTGYRPILESLYSFSDACCGGGATNGKCCRDKPNSVYEEKLATFADSPKYDPTQELIFPPSLRAIEPNDSVEVLKGSRVDVHIPKSLKQLEEVLDENQGVKVVSSGLITRMITASKATTSEKWVSTRHIPEFSRITKEGAILRIGSSVSIEKFVEAIICHCHENVRSQIEKFFHQFSSAQVANFATWTGSIVMAARSRVAVNDLLILFETLNWKLTVLLKNGERRVVTIAEWFESELLDRVVIDALIDTTENRRVFFYKIGESATNDSTIFNFAAALSPNRINIGVGGRPVRLEPLEEHLEICRDPESMLNYCGQCLKVDDGAKKRLMKAVVSKFWEFLEETEPIEESNFSYLQFYKPKNANCVGRPLANHYGERAITGETVYVNDIKTYDALYIGVVLSTHAHAEILSIDPSEALKLDGVEGFFSVKDVPGLNVPGLDATNVVFPDDTPIFADGKVESIGQIIGAIAASDQRLARRAAKLVKVDYKPLKALIDFKEAREANSLHGKVQNYGKPLDEINAALDSCEHVVDGEISIGGQDHLYMEPQSSLVIPGEDNEFVVHCSTQGTGFTQVMMAKALNIPAHKIIVKTKRLGGGFGGKVNVATWLATICAIAARRLKKPVFGCYTRNEDLLITGKRHAVYAKYRVGFESSGKVKALHYEAYLNGGWSKDHTEGVTMVLGLTSSDVYDYEMYRLDGYPVKTNTNSNTAMRGYGIPQQKLMNEEVMRRIAFIVGKKAEDVKELNFLHEGGFNFCGQQIRDDALIECWRACKQLSDFEKREKLVDEFNKSSKLAKRGLAISTVRFGLPHPGPSHGSASVLINIDGSVQLTIGGTEMGQGLNTKMMQVCAEALNRPIDEIAIIDTSTDKLVNAPETGGSQNADVHGLAVKACCDRLLQGLKSILEKNDGDWHKAVIEAYGKVVPLQCTEYGHVKRAEFGVKPHETPYTTTGACAVEVEIDCLTGLNKLRRVDIVMDVGESLNPAIDIGQIEGAFMQAYGLVTSERITFDAAGKLEQASLGKYKVPRADQVPPVFNVKLLGVEKHKNTQVYSSKGIGEPPLIMSAGAIHSALMKSIESQRAQNGIGGFAASVSPLHAQQIVDLCNA